MVWDRIFAVDPELHLVDLICVAMLLRIRWRRKWSLSVIITATERLQSSRRIILQP